MKIEYLRKQYIKITCNGSSSLIFSFWSLIKFSYSFFMAERSGRYVLKSSIRYSKTSRNALKEREQTSSDMKLTSYSRRFHKNLGPSHLVLTQYPSLCLSSSSTMNLCAH